MSVIDEFLANNEAYAGQFDKGSLPMPPAKQLPAVKAVRRHAQPTRYFCNAMTSLNHLADRFDLELFGISFATHLHLS